MVRNEVVTGGVAILVLGIHILKNGREGLKLIFKEKSG